MAHATTLSDAAYYSYDQASIFWNANTIRAALSGFITQASPFFEDQVPNDRPVGNWLAIMSALSGQIGQAPLSANPLAQEPFNQIVEYLYRICYAGSVALADSTISSAQAAGLLAAWNAHFGT